MVYVANADDSTLWMMNSPMNSTNS
jgi:hypothetical protein